jgi:hypothetical protein
VQGDGKSFRWEVFDNLTAMLHIIPDPHTHVLTAGNYKRFE